MILRSLSNSQTIANHLLFHLQVHFEAAGGSKAAMGLPVLHNVEVRSLVAFYFIAMVVFGFLHSVLSVIFVVDAVISEKGEPMPIQIPMSVDVPEEWDGQVVDPCVTSISAPGCEYDLAINTLASQLITYTPYTVGGKDSRISESTLETLYL